MAEVVPIRKHPSTPEPPALFQADESIANLIPGGEHLTANPVFGDDEWDLAGHPAWTDKAGQQTRIKFHPVPARWRPALKELALLQLNPDLAPASRPDNTIAQAWPHLQEPIRPLTAQGNIKALCFAVAAVDNIDFSDPQAWDRVELLLPQPTSVADKQSGATLGLRTVRGRAQQLVALWQVTQIAGRHHLLGVSRPFGGRELNEVFGRKANRNRVRPHENVGYALGFVAWFFDHVAENIVEHLEWWSANVTHEAAFNRDLAAKEMAELLAAVAARNDNALPAGRNTNGGASLAAAPLARLIGIYDADQAYLIGRTAFQRMHPRPRLVVGASPCPVPIVEVPTTSGDTIPWTTSLLPAQSELDLWQRRLVYYAMYYLSATIMLRDSQIATLPLDALSTEEVTRPNGVTYTRRTLHVFKTKNRYRPVDTEVTVNGRVARIIQLLQRMQRALGYEPALNTQTGLPFLFDHRLALPIGKKAHSRSRQGMYLDLNFLKHMRDGARDLHAAGAITRDLDMVQLSMRQVRITCAQAYAVREHGQALAAAYGQWDTKAVAQGYIGDIYRLITPADPDETKDLAREDIGRRLVDAAERRGDPRGNGTRRLDDTVSRNHAALANPQALSPARLKTLGKRNPNIEQGPLTLCVFQTEGALCGGKGKPDFRLCLPGQCRNSVMSRADRARYELMRRQHLRLNSPVLRRAADRMNDLNPQIAEEFADLSDDELADIIKTHVDDYIRRALEDRP